MSAVVRRAEYPRAVDDGRSASPTVGSTHRDSPPAVRTSTATRRRSRTLRLPRVPVNGLSLALIASVIVTVFVLFGLGGWRYYWSPQDVRAYTDLHPLLRPSGVVGNLLGIAGVGLMIIMHVYTLRKKVHWMGRLGSPTIWLEFHIFCGVLGPVLITLHTSFKFNGLISVAYWSMVIVVLSGFVGRYLYVRIPRSIRGIELTDAELITRAAEATRRLASSDLPPTVAAKVRAFEKWAIPASESDATWSGLVVGDLGVNLRFRALSRLAHRSSEAEVVAESLSLIRERAVLLRRMAYLKKTRKLFDLWRIYHKPLAILMAIIVLLHVATVVYLGYGWAL